GREAPEEELVQALGRASLRDAGEPGARGAEPPALRPQHLELVLRLLEVLPELLALGAEALAPASEPLLVAEPRERERRVARVAHEEVDLVLREGLAPRGLVHEERPEELALRFEGKTDDGPEREVLGLSLAEGE